MKTFPLSDFAFAVSEIAKERGFELKGEQDSSILFPVYDETTGMTRDWFCIYVRERKERVNGIPKTS